MSTRTASVSRNPSRKARIAWSLIFLLLGVLIGKNWPGPRRHDASLSSEHTIRPDDDSPISAPGALAHTPPTEYPKRAKPNASKSTGHPAIQIAATITSPATDASAPAIAKNTASPGSALSSKSPPSAPNVPTTSIALVEPVVTLRGTLTADDRLPIELEFSLSRKGRVITGVVRYLAPDGKRVAANTVAGDLAERVVRLRETSRIWIRLDPVSGIDFAFSDPGRSFVFEFPEQPVRTEIIGKWTLGETTGKLMLSLASPW